MGLPRVLGDFARRSKVHVGFALIANLAVVAMPALHVAKPVPGIAAVPAACAPSTACALGQPAALAPTLTLPADSTPCPMSGPAAACRLSGAAAEAAPGEASVPVGMVSCPSSIDKPLPVGATLAACRATPFDSESDGGSGPPVVSPGGPVSSAGRAWPQGISLSADGTTISSGDKVVLTATASDTVTGTGAAIEIFDVTIATPIGACGQLSQCIVAYRAKGGTHTFAAFITSPTGQMPTDGGAIMSNRVSVGWLESSIAASSLLAAPGEKVTLTATSTIDVHSSGRWLEIYDLTSHSRITYCSLGTACSTTMSAPAGGVHEIVAHINGSPESVSAPVNVTWLTVRLVASTLTQARTGSVNLQATVNADLTKTSWQLGIYDGNGRLVGSTCTTGTTCIATSWVDGVAVPTYTAAVSALSSDEPTPMAGAGRRGIGSPRMQNVVAQSAPVQPAHLVWGVDSCKAFTSDPNAASGLYRQVVSMLGSPDFWGRYLTDTVCPGISPNEVLAAASNHMGILPIYNDYNCSAVSSYPTGAAYATSAVAAAHNLGIPRGSGLAIDIEPAGPDCPGAANIDSAFIEGWFDGIQGAGYVPIYYGNGTAQSEFASAWCAAATDLPTVAADSYLWSFEPSLLGNFVKANAPSFAPYAPACAETMGAWQYTISVGSAPDVDRDLALSSMPLWYP